MAKHLKLVIDDAFSKSYITQDEKFQFQPIINKFRSILLITDDDFKIIVKEIKDDDSKQDDPKQDDPNKSYSGVVIALIVIGFLLLAIVLLLKKRISLIY